METKTNNNIIYGINEGSEIEEKHHIQQELCTTRCPYRQGKKLTAVKVYTVSSESQHLFIYGVPKINLRSELKSLCLKYGVVKNIHVVADRKTEIFTECYHVQYEHIQSARIAKRLIDNKSFYGQVLHVCYAPEFESVQETRYKLHQRKADVMRRLNDKTPEISVDAYKEPGRKRKMPAIPITEERMEALDPMLVWKNVPADIDPSKPSNSKKAFFPQKHYQTQNKHQYGPSAQFYISNVRKDVHTTLLPTQVIKPPVNLPTKIFPEKRIVFRNKPN